MLYNAPWGKVRQYRKSAKYDFTFSIELEEIIIGLMLGVLYAEISKKSSNARPREGALEFKQSAKNKAYVDHLYALFKNYCNSPPKVTTTLDLRPGKKELKDLLNFEH